MCLLVLLAWLAVPVAKADVIPCGTPSYDPATDRGIFLWQDCTTGAWSFRAMGGGTQFAVDGELNSTYPFTDYTPYSVEGTDRLDSPVSTRIAYSFRTWNSGVDGFDFVLPTGANATFSLVTTGIPVLVGPNRVAMTAPFNLLDLSGAPQFDGQPTYNPATDLGAFLWRTSDGGWHLRVTGAGTSTSFTGSIKSNRAFTAVTPVDLESGDTLDTTNSAQIRFDFMAVSGQDGVDFSFPVDSSVCFTLATPDQPVLIGPNRVPIMGSFDLETLSPCGGGTPSQDGQPAYDPATQAGLFLWRDGPGGGWHLRVTAGGGSADYRGEIVSSAPFTSVNGVSIESQDVLDTSTSGRISFDLRVWNTGQDGVDFAFPATASVCFALQGASPTVLMGAGITSVPTPVDLATLGPCVSTGGNMNMVVIMTDDQRFDTLSKMANVTNLLVSRGVTFNNAYVPTPLCCPSRATMYSGGFLAKNTGVQDNTLPDGSASIFNDTTNLGTVLQQAGYQTFFGGKWLNGYHALGLYVPPGWDQFVGRQTEDASGTGWFDFTYTVGSSTAQHSSTGTRAAAGGQYNVYFERDRLLNFLNHLQPGKPFFAFWASTPPHPPATPPAEDSDLFANFVYRGRGYTETDLSDKPRWVQRNGLPADDDNFVRKQLRTLQSVDRSVADIVAKVTALGQLDNTVFVFTSDNGYLWGEHGLWGKNKVYEEAIRVPLVVVLPGVASRTDNHLVSSNLDLGPTLYELAGAPRQTDGISLVPLLNDPNAPWRTELFFEKESAGNYDNAVWGALRRGDWKYVKYWDGEEEFYNLNTDPYELESRHKDASVSSIKASMAARTQELLGLAIVPVRPFPAGKVNTSFNYQFKPWGGVAPFTWKIASGQLPNGLTLDTATGAVHGTPTKSGSFTFSVRVTDSSMATQAQHYRTYESPSYTMVVNP